MELDIRSDSFDWCARFLSNFWPSFFVLDDEELSSVEGFIQGIKFPEGDLNRSAAFRSVMGEAKKFSEKAERKYVWWKGEEIPYGSVEHHALIERAIRAKFGQNSELRYALQETKNLVLINQVLASGETSLPAPVFCDILTRIRAEYKLAGARVL
ncbi:MAG: hypothetical protein AAB631_02915 [Patescibacteria group bacterium]